MRTSHSGIYKRGKLHNVYRQSMATCRQKVHSSSRLALLSKLLHFKCKNVWSMDGCTPPWSPVSRPLICHFDQHLVMSKQAHATIAQQLTQSRNFWNFLRIEEEIQPLFEVSHMDSLFFWNSYFIIQIFLPNTHELSQNWTIKIHLLFVIKLNY